ncbi:RDD family protein [Anaerotignum sp.]|uniref:RDD family protein n=1 Tax=Anaerotignum sp. TaxID=2039241 RepID=UPI002A91420B|nr:RDD family protein [Anaerotignum sp.]MCI7657294.1 RDD family protein [Clostridia bacterium]MDY5415518.1 RDD family protein [Anaerotignum sp.]
MTASMTEWNTTQLDAETMKADCPWRRFFARSLDLLICSTIYELFMGAILRINLLDRSFLLSLVDIYMSFGILFLLEPLLLNRFGTTLGKWILGISLSKIDGGNLSYEEGFSRLCQVFWRGYGLQIPIYNLVRLYKSYTLCSEEGKMTWDTETLYHVQPNRWYRVIGFIAAYGVVMCISVGASFWGSSPLHVGAITPQEFVENYNQDAKFLSKNRHKKDALIFTEGNNIYTLSESPFFEDDLTAIFIDKDIPAKMEITETDGIVTALTITHEVPASADSISTYEQPRLLSIRNLLYAQKGFHRGFLPPQTTFTLTDNGKTVTANPVVMMVDHPVESFTGTLEGWEMTQTISYDREAYSYWNPLEMIQKNEEGPEATQPYTMTFSLKKVN